MCRARAIRLRGVDFAPGARSTGVRQSNQLGESWRESAGWLATGPSALVRGLERAARSGRAK